VLSGGAAEAASCDATSMRGGGLGMVAGAFDGFPATAALTPELLNSDRSVGGPHPTTVAAQSATAAAGRRKRSIFAYEPDFFGLVLSLELLLAEPGVEELDELELGIDELDELLLDGGVEALDLSELDPLAVPFIEALPLMEPEAPGVALLLVAELGDVVSVELEVELDGVLLVVAGVAEVLLLLVPLLRSQPVTAAVATASTATRGISLFMTSPFGAL
jgi:hypothetical protein